MKRLLFLIFYGFFLFIQVEGQETSSVSSAELALIAQVNQGNSYITFPADIGNIEPLWFEANLSPEFYIRKSKDSRLMGVLTPQIIIRMYQERSFPVRTPSYMPQITAYYLMSPKKDKNTFSLFGKIAHHSNGQDGDFYLENGEVNLLSGDFATNYFEAGIIKTNYISRFDAHQFLKTSLEIHPTGWSADELAGRYSTVRWHNSFSIFKLAADKNQDDSQKPNISIKGETTWMFGNYNNLETFAAERLNLSLTFYYHPKFLEDIGLFVQYYHGSDYYNMYFNHRLDVLRFGIMTEKLRY
ncbi:MAG TPA: hypothetical protein PKE03_12125 [Bacteroidales bacterium]|nr:hypothetical protein [Bacteroidales bacterium]